MCPIPKKLNTLLPKKGTQVQWKYDTEIIESGHRYYFLIINNLFSLTSSGFTLTQREVVGTLLGGVTPSLFISTQPSLPLKCCCSVDENGRKEEREQEASIYVIKKKRPGSRNYLGFFGGFV